MKGKSELFPFLPLFFKLKPRHPSDEVFLYARTEPYKTAMFINVEISSCFRHKTKR